MGLLNISKGQKTIIQRNTNPGVSDSNVAVFYGRLQLSNHWGDS